jgi:aspartokinase
MVKVLSTDNPNKAAIVKQMLEENNIKVVLLNKQDSSYLMFGLVELYVQEDQVEKTENLLKEINNERNT